MEPSKKRSRDSRFHNEYTAQEMEAADSLLKLCHLGFFLVNWTVKRRRSATDRGGFSDTRITHQSKLANRSPVTLLGLSWSENDNSDARPSKDISVKNVPPRRLPKKKTHKELKEMVNTLSLEKSGLKKEEEQLMKTYQELQDRNYNLKSQLVAHLDQRQEQKPLSTPQTSCYKGSSHGTDSSDHFIGTLALNTVYDGPMHAGVPLNPHESSPGPEKRDFYRPTKDFSCFLGLPDLNAPAEAMCDMVPNGFHEEMLLSRNKVVVAAEARRRRIELTRVKYARKRKVRSR